MRGRYMSNNDIWGLLGKKKSTNSLTIPSKKTNNTASAPTANASTTTVQAKTVEAPKVRPHKVKKHRPQKHIHQQQVQQEAMKPQLSDYRLATTGDQTGVHIATIYRDTPVHQFSLLRTDYALWQRMTPQQKYDFVRIRTNANAFGNDMSIVNAVIIGTVNVLNNIFAEAARIRTQQAHRNMI
jgi:hypothetical protein